MIRKMFSFLIFTLSSYYVSTTYDFTGKIALVTGGSKGIGYETISEMLNNGVKGITMISRNLIKGKAAAKELNEKFGAGRVIFIPADISNSKQLEDAFKFSNSYWSGLDIVINNAAVADEVNWNFSVNVNVMGSLQGTFLGFKYMSVAKGGRGGVIINLSSVVAIDSAFTSPVYSPARTFTNSFGRAFGHGLYHNYNQVRIITVCPGATFTDNFVSYPNATSESLAPNIRQLAVAFQSALELQPPSVVAKGIVHVIKVAKSGSVWVSEGSEIYEIDFPHRKSLEKEN